MTNYELAKKLKDAGFPQTGLSGQWPSNGPRPEDQVYAPTLSELIEACGNRISAILQWDRDGNKWSAQADGDSRSSEYGNTPKEAVANLWLKLNEK